MSTVTGYVQGPENGRPCPGLDSGVFVRNNSSGGGGAGVAGGGPWATVDRRVGGGSPGFAGSDSDSDSVSGIGGWLAGLARVENAAWVALAAAE